MTKLQTEVADLAQRVNQLLQSIEPLNNDRFKAAELATDLVRYATEDIEDDELLSEILSPFKHFGTQVTGYFIMNLIASPALSCDGLTDEDKAFWCQVAGPMGPDWIAHMARVAAFMKVANSFR